MRIGSPGDAIDAGIGMVHQHFMLIPVMTVAENVVLASEPRSGPFLDLREARKRVLAVSDQLGLAVDPDARVEEISVGQQQRVEIVKALYRNARILILDEPTAVLTPQEASDLFRILNTLRGDMGTSVIFITHKLGEVLELADRITVLRRGKAVGTVPREGATEESLARLMVGREVLLRVEKQPSHPERAGARGRRPARARRPRARGGARRLARRAPGRDRRHRRRRRKRPGRARRGDHRAAPADGRHDHGRGARHLARPTPGRASTPGVGHIPEDRHRRGLVLEFTLAENLALHDYRKQPASHFGILSPGRLVSRARGLLERVRRPRRRPADARGRRSRAETSRRS